MDLPSELSPYVRVAYDSVLRPPGHLRERVIFDYEFLYVKAGRVDVTIGPEAFTGTRGDVFIFRPRQPHSFRISGEEALRQPHVHFDLVERADSAQVPVSFCPEEEIPPGQRSMFRPDRLDELGVRFPGKITLRNPAAFEELLFEIIGAFAQKRPLCGMTMKAAMIRLILRLAGEAAELVFEMGDAGLRPIYRAREHIDAHYADRITLHGLAAAANISKYHFNRLFAQTFGVSPIRYRNRIRIQRAQELMRFTNLTLTAIAGMVGYADMQAFSRAFRRHEGMPPSAYRRKNGSGDHSSNE